MEEPLAFEHAQFDALRNAFYHAERRSFFDRLDRWLSFLIIILGAGVFGKIAHGSESASNYLELSVVVAATLQLVFDFKGRAHMHDTLGKRYYEFLADLDIAADRDPRELSAKLIRMCADEPLSMRALDATAYNQAVDATTDDLDLRKLRRLHIVWWHRRLRHVCAFQSVLFVPSSPR